MRIRSVTPEPPTPAPGPPTPEPPPAPKPEPPPTGQGPNAPNSLPPAPPAPPYRPNGEAPRGPDRNRPKPRKLEAEPGPRPEEPTAGRAPGEGEPAGPRIDLYGAGWCGYTHRAKALLRNRGIAFAFYDLDSRPDLRTRLLELSGNATVPQVLIDQRPIGGYAELVQLDRAGGLDGIRD